MGDEISVRHFEAVDFSRFRRLLEEETEHVTRLFDSNGFSTRGDIVGFELEACIVDEAGNPKGLNQEILDTLNNPLVVPELSQFNVELNGSPCSLTGRAFSRLHDELASTWDACQNAAKENDTKLVQVGILPTMRRDLLNSRNMSDMVRYRALNDRIIALRDGADLRIAISGCEDLNLLHQDVMLEAATTSFQIHLQCKPYRAVRDFNAAIAVSAPMVALSANSPYLFGKDLWAETRIPLFEQATHIGERHLQRVIFGSGYAKDSLCELFSENRLGHTILLPFVQPEPINKYAHLRFQNGTIWRWNRPLIGFDYDGQPHLRIEHRVVPSGPTVIDCIANCAVFIGFVRALGRQETPIEEILPFEVARDNFYAAAQLGLDAEITWINGEKLTVSDLILNNLLPMAGEALELEEVPSDEVDKYLGIIKDRVASGMNGATWQRSWVEAHGNDLAGLTRSYFTHQESNEPVHTWDLT